MFTNFKPIVMRGRNLNRLSVLALLLTLLGGAILLHLNGMTPLARAQQCDIFGIINSDRTLGPTAEGCDIYNATGSLVVNEGVTLTIEPGTTMRFGADLGMTVRGTLIAQGTSSNPILFSAGTASNWSYIYFSPTSVPGSFDFDGNYLDGSIIQYATIEKAGSSDIRDNGALRAENSVPYIDNVTIRNSNAYGINIFDLDRTNYGYRITNSTITDNAGGIAVEGIGANVQGTLLNNTIRDNTLDSGSGAGIYLYFTGTNSAVTVDGNTVTGNTAKSFGGGMYIFGASNTTFSLTNNTISGNTANGSGGGVYFYTQNSIIRNNTINDNQGSSGGGVYLDYNTTTLSGNTINGNSVRYDGGGVYISGSDNSLADNTISNNTAADDGGGIFHYSGNNTTLTSNTISGNSADDHGAAIMIYRGSPTLTFNNIINNRAKNQPSGGIYIPNGYDPLINNNDIYGNTGSGGNYDIYNTNTSSADDIDATGNYWNSTSATAIENRVFHGIDDAAFGLVNYTPFSNSAVGTGPEPPPTPTVTPTPTATPTNTAIPTSTPRPSPTPTTPPAGTIPVIQSVNPAEGASSQTTRITIQGNGFATSPAPTIRLSGSAGRFDLTNVTAVSAASFAATVPANLPAGTYDLIVTNPNGRVGTLPNAFTVLAGDPVITQVLPNSGLNDRDNDIVIAGLNFAAGAEVTLGTTALATSRVNGTALLAVVPAGLSPGSYDLTVTNPGGGQAQLVAAYTVLNEESSNDLIGSSDELWLDPEVPRAGSNAQVGLFVHRQGGTAALENVTVEFRRDKEDGPVLGRGTVPFLDPVNGVESSTPVEVTFPNAGTVEIYAIIDPDKTVTESNEKNNVVSRTVVVAPAADDRTVPVVQSIATNGAAGATVSEPEVAVDISAADPPPDATGMQAVNVIEYVYNTSVEQWIPVKQSGWLPYDQTPARTQWKLLPLPGMHYLQVRARDNADNISIGNARQLVNYAPAKDTIGRRQTRVYRYNVPDGQSLTVNLEVLSGDADLYVWSSRTDQSARVSNLEDSANEQVSVPAAQVAPGVYQVEVYGYTAAEYRITTNVGPAQAALQAELTVGGVSPDKTMPDAPVVPVDSLPDERQGAAPALAPEDNGTIYLPLVVR